MNLLSICIPLAGLAALLGFYRLLKGPRQADRVVALDVLFAVAVLLAVAAALMTNHIAFLDIALGLALVGFIGTLAWARFIDRQSGGPRGEN
ncbi:MAG: cation:proton antiporter [Gammaproteobacteria bacterium]|nr:cation:proton antiporter [Gammaproteobacteria bacterium]